MHRSAKECAQIFIRLERENRISVIRRKKGRRTSWVVTKDWAAIECSASQGWSCSELLRLTTWWSENAFDVGSRWHGRDGMPEKNRRKARDRWSTEEVKENRRNHCISIIDARSSFFFLWSLSCESCFFSWEGLPCSSEREPVEKDPTVDNHENMTRWRLFLRLILANQDRQHDVRHW